MVEKLNLKNPTYLRIVQTYVLKIFIFTGSVGFVLKMHRLDTPEY
jgi:hypothetical protein